MRDVWIDEDLPGQARELTKRELNYLADTCRRIETGARRQRNNPKRMETLAVIRSTTGRMRRAAKKLAELPNLLAAAKAELRNAQLANRRAKRVTVTTTYQPDVEHEKFVEAAKQARRETIERKAAEAKARYHAYHNPEAKAARLAAKVQADEERARKDALPPGLRENYRPEGRYCHFQWAKELVVDRLPDGKLRPHVVWTARIEGEYGPDAFKNSD